MKTARIMAVAALIVASGLALHAAWAQQQPGFARTDLLRHDLSVPGREVVQTYDKQLTALLVIDPYNDFIS
jgi:hypothetical protein